MTCQCKMHINIKAKDVLNTNVSLQLTSLLNKNRILKKTPHNCICQLNSTSQ